MQVFLVVNIGIGVGLGLERDWDPRFRSATGFSLLGQYAANNI